MPEALTADIRMEREGAVADDAFDLAFHYPRGLRADLRSSILAAVTRPRFLLARNARRIRQTIRSIRKKATCGAATFPLTLRGARSRKKIGAC